ncbi:uncharacterized protein GVI51_D01749 [Nakaseomyces glabratus]|uniref:uncharacterized protein n=1 Tax=Candida glabrata TaxID=5478 RepID=UPI00138C1FBE|nr:hypothetical protein J7298_00750 [Nakaseomyces glabratus]KAH7606436.1 hypothetical protein J7295_00753 [Nakaseomyces glabratus]KAH7608229.1 hypothetical protein J7293_00745 [Nakaseomyces glabratus]KAH7608346.1 hypothetical protein J7294_00745 [Nakaseomyces glabratus]KAH7614860.1 hypothetical protein J7292_00729 [Nakaseomyces glabratus]
MSSEKEERLQTVPLRYLAKALLYLLIVNISFKLFKYYGKQPLVDWIYESGGESLTWWQQLPLIERMMWSMADYLENK